MSRSLSYLRPGLESHPMLPLRVRRLWLRVRNMLRTFATRRRSRHTVRLSSASVRPKNVEQRNSVTGLPILSRKVSTSLPSEAGQALNGWRCIVCGVESPGGESPLPTPRGPTGSRRLAPEARWPHSVQTGEPVQRHRSDGDCPTSPLGGKLRVRPWQTPTPTDGTRDET